MDDIINFFGEYKTFFVMAHVFAVVVGMGSAMVSDILFNLYIKDKKINPVENKTLAILSRIIWIALGVIVLSGLMTYLSDPIKYASSTKFLLKMVVVGVIIINGYLFWSITHKALRKINFTDTNVHHKYVRVRKLSFAFGAVSLVSWLSAFVLGSLQSIAVSFQTGLISYLLIVIVMVIGSQIVEYHITHPKKVVK